MSTATAHSTEDGALRWFQRLMWAGIIANVVVGIVSIAYTPQVLALAKVDPATPLVWPRLSAMLVMLLAGFYIPAAIDPCAHRFAAVFAVVCRFAGTIFMAVVGGHYIIFGLFDFVFGAPQAICLYLAWQRMNAAPDVRASGSTIVALLAGLLAVGAFAWGAFQWLTQPILPAFASDEEYFKYGSIGNDGAGGIPYPIWIAMPDVCAHHLPRPQGYAAFGLLYERGRNPAIDPPIGFSRAKVGVERMAINCAVCHTSAGSPINAGGRALETPFGIIYATNITPDVETGIGAWSYPAFERAMREGIHRNGRHLYPAFPYTHYARATDADLQALYAYLMAQAPVRATTLKNELRFPFNLRPLLAGWNALFHLADTFKPDPTKSEMWNRGAYLVESLGHCSACHSPRNALGAEISSAYLAGGLVEGWEAPPLTSLSSAPIPWSEDELYVYLRTGESRFHGTAAGPMAPIVRDLSALPDQDIRAMAVYLASDAAAWTTGQSFVIDGGFTAR